MFGPGSIAGGERAKVGRQTAECVGADLESETDALGSGCMDLVPAVCRVNGGDGNDVGYVHLGGHLLFVQGL